MPKASRDRSLGTFGQNMNSFERPLCKAPRTAIATNVALAIALACLAYLFPRFAILFYSMASLFIACGVLFVVLLFVNPQTRIVISTDRITRRGVFGERTIRFADIASAVLGTDPEAENQLRLDVSSQDGSSMTIDSRFIPSRECDLLTVLSHSLAVQGKSLEVRK